MSFWLTFFHCTHSFVLTHNVIWIKDQDIWCMNCTVNWRVKWKCLIVGHPAPPSSTIVAPYCWRSEFIDSLINVTSTALSVIIAEDMQDEANSPLNSVILGHSLVLYSKYQGKCLKYFHACENDYHVTCLCIYSDLSFYYYYLLNK